MYQQKPNMNFQIYQNILIFLNKYFSADYPDIIKTVKNSPLIFVNVDELLDFPRPIFSNIIYIGGLENEEQNRENELAVELIQFLASFCTSRSHSNQRWKGASKA